MHSMVTPILISLCLAVVNPSPADAQFPFATPVGDDAKIEGSKTFFYAATSYYASGDFQAAFEELAKAWDLVHNPAYAYDAALALWRCDEPFRARVWLRRVPDSHPGWRQLAQKIATAIDEDDRAWGYEQRCDEKTRYCGWGTGWPKISKTSKKH